MPVIPYPFLERAAPEVCTTSACVNTAKSILEYIDFNADPCSDFYQYTCGSWLETIPFEEAADGPMDKSMNKMNDHLKAILQEDFDTLYSSLIDTQPDQKQLDRENYQAMRDYYDVCMDTKTIQKVGSSPFFQDLAMIQDNLLPIPDQTAVFSQNDSQSLATLIGFFNRIGLPALNDISISDDYQRPGYSVVTISQPKLALQAKEPYQVPESIKVLKESVVHFLNKTIGHPQKGSDNYDYLHDQSKAAHFEFWSESKIQAAAERFVMFETQLANISHDLFFMRNYGETYNPTSLNDFQTNYPYVNWTGVLELLVVPDDPVPDTVIDLAPGYHAQLTTLLADHQVSLLTLQEYFIINLLLHKKYAMDESIYSIVQGLDSKKPQTKSDRSAICVEKTSELFPNTLGRFYIFKYFGGESERSKVDSLVTQIHEAFYHMIQNAVWLDEVTRTRAIDKLNSMVQKIAFNIVSPDLRDPASIKAYGEVLYINKTSYFQTEALATETVHQKTWSQLYQPIDKDAWLLPTQTYNAYYSPSANDITILAGMLQDLSYTPGAPDYLNYAGIGGIIGHEIVHGFDSNGRKFTGEGLLSNWWEPSSSEKFDQGSQCFIDQYSQFNVTDAEGNVYNTNGKLTLGENIADNGGLAAALAAYRKVAQANPELSLPGLEEFSNEAMFFISYGVNWCSKREPAVNIQLLSQDVHSIDKFRVNGVVQNSEDFAKAFNCPLGSPMNPVNKCKIW